MPPSSGRGIEFRWIETRTSPCASRARRARSLSETVSSPLARHHDPEEAAEELAPDPLGDVERDLLLDQAVGGVGTGIRPAVPGVEDDRLHVEVKERGVDRLRRGPGDGLQARLGRRRRDRPLRDDDDLGRGGPAAGEGVDRGEEGEGHAHEGDGAEGGPRPPPLPPKARRGTALDHLQVLPDGVAQHLALQAVDTSHAQPLIFAAFRARGGKTGALRARRGPRAPGEPSPPSIRSGRATRS